MSGVMHAAKHYNKSFLITAELAEGGKKTFRVRAQSERVAREKFEQHHNQATIVSVKEEGVTEDVDSKGPWLNNKTNKWVAWYKKDSKSDPITISADSEEEVQSQLKVALDKIQSQRSAKTTVKPGQSYDFGLSSMVLRDLVGMEKGAPIYLKLGPNKTIDVSTESIPGFVKGKITKSPAGYGHLFRVSGNDVTNSGMAGSTRYDVKKIASNGTLTRLQITGEGRPYYSTHDLEAGGLDHKPSAVIRVPGRNLAQEGLDDLTGPLLVNKLPVISFL
jgi:hypothetical protein